MKNLFVIVSIALCVAGGVMAITGYDQLSEGMPGFYLSRNIAELQGDANELLLGIGWLLGGIAVMLGGLTSAVLAVVFSSQSKAKENHPT